MGQDFLYKQYNVKLEDILSSETADGRLQIFPLQNYIPFSGDDIGIPVVNIRLASSILIDFCI